MPVKTLEQPAGAFQISEGKAAEGDPGTGANRLLPGWPPPAGVWRGRPVMCHLRARHMELTSKPSDGRSRMHKPGPPLRPDYSSHTPPKGAAACLPCHLFLGCDFCPLMLSAI